MTGKEGRKIRRIIREIAEKIAREWEKRKKKPGRPRKYPLEAVVYAFLVRAIEGLTYRSVVMRRDVRVGTFQNLHAHLKRMPEDLLVEALRELEREIRKVASRVSEAVHGDGSVKRLLGREKVKRKWRRKEREVWERKGIKMLVIARYVWDHRGRRHWAIVDVEVGEKREADQKMVARMVERCRMWGAKVFRGDANIVSGEGPGVLRRRGIRVEDRRQEEWNFEGIFGMIRTKIRPLYERIYMKKALYWLLLSINVRTLAILRTRYFSLLPVRISFAPIPSMPPYRVIPQGLC